MAFTDRAKIHVQGGHGGGGCVSFRRESRVPKGGPDGGNGGRGGSVVVIADPAVEDLSRYRHVVHHKARPGQPGSGRRKHGKNGEDSEIHVPLGTRIIRDDEEIAFLNEPGERAEVAVGGEGGIGNHAFRSSTHQTPRESVPGMPGDEGWIILELRMPLSVAIVGLPNSGKSALLNALTGAVAPVAEYPRTSRQPEFGPLKDEYGNLFLVADLPGVDEQGRPRRDGYLGQLERAEIILHCVDGRDPELVDDALAQVREGISPYVSPGTPEIVVATHVRGDAPDGVDVAVDSFAGMGIDDLRDTLLARLRAGV